LGKNFAEVMSRFTIAMLLYHFTFDLIEDAHKDKKPEYGLGGAISPKIMMAKSVRNKIIS
jgi:hypothetical protein